MLTSERVEEIREWAAALAAMADLEQSAYARSGSAGNAAWAAEHGAVWGDLVAIIDAYEAQRPRPASEVPGVGVEVLIKTRAGGARSVGFHDGSGDEPMWHTEDGTWSTDDIECWWPLPQVQP